MQTIVILFDISYLISEIFSGLKRIELRILTERDVSLLISFSNSMCTSTLCKRFDLSCVIIWDYL